MWPSWAGPAAAGLSFLYGAAGVYWAAGGAGFPFGVAHDPLGRGVSPLDHATPGAAGPVIAVVGFAAAALAVALSRGRRGGVPGAVLVWCGVALAVALGVVIPDYRPLLAVVRAPLILGGAPFGWPREVGLGDFLPLFLPWPVLNELLLMVAGLLFAAAALTYRRRVRGACAWCGRTGGTVGWTAPAAAAEAVPRVAGEAGGWTAVGAAARWGRYAVVAAVAVPVLYALTRWCWALGIPLGVSAAGLRAEAADSPGIWLVGAMLATMAAGGGWLTVGLVRPWGEVYPRWIPFLRGRRVRPRTAIVPASLVALLVTSAGMMFVREFAVGRFHLTADTWGLFLPEMLWPLWGAALAAATLAYHLRRRGRCARCGRM
jgi:hypothetical protein